MCCNSSGRMEEIISCNPLRQTVYHFLFLEIGADAAPAENDDPVHQIHHLFPRIPLFGTGPAYWEMRELLATRGVRDDRPDAVSKV